MHWFSISFFYRLTSFTGQCVSMPGKLIIKKVHVIFHMIMKMIILQFVIIFHMVYVYIGLLILNFTDNLFGRE